MSWGRRYSDPFAFGRHVGSLRSRRKINAVLSETREKFGEGVMRRGSDFLKDEDVENG